MSWRVGSRIPLNVYDGDDRPVCQCHTEDDARLIVAAVNRAGELAKAIQTIHDAALQVSGIKPPWVHAVNAAFEKFWGEPAMGLEI